MGTISPGPLAEAFVEVADTLVDDFDLIDFLGSVTGHVARLSGTAAVGLLLADHRGHLQFMAASEESARLLELFAIQNDQGPCRDCFGTGEAVIVADLSQEHQRWPAFTPRAMVAGFRSVCALPLRHNGTVIGALNLFGTAAEHLSDEDVRIVQSLAHVATIGILQQQALRRGEMLTEQLQGALNSRIVIEQAKGALAQLHGTDVDTAYNAMRDYSRRKGLRMGTVALEVVSDTHSHPELTMRPGTGA
ncbi:GAF and ANTAR domain-containing protein [Ornithinimicrobium sediminis]|uniref:GAF and ANTAR domain-containing protein n=1 Tax=Ornithinimicrobium sediminis TaxID=2904603 RepID=UPI001E61F417|nr:GAF and ANTAR domain-containing protein [Ornithinimicrobium sediminis]MCE0487235.1 GAF and ANTAR domain-containing protein [Ornithinimicrobium sediminis]